MLVLRGWANECARLDELLSAVHGGENGALVVRGEAGIGKTALLDYVAAQAARCRVVRVVGVVSRTVKDLVVGSDSASRIATCHDLEGGGGEWHVYALAAD